MIGDDDGGAGREGLTENEIGRIVVDEAIALHREIGPGLLESVYEAVLADGLRVHGLQVSRQMKIPITVRGREFDEGFRADLLVQNLVILEMKSVGTIQAVHKKQLLTYLKVSGLKLGFLLNFGERLMKDGIVRIVNGLGDEEAQ